MKHENNSKIRLNNDHYLFYAHFQHSGSGWRALGTQAPTCDQIIGCPLGEIPAETFTPLAKSEKKLLEPPVNQILDSLMLRHKGSH